MRTAIVGTIIVVVMLVVGVVIWIGGTMLDAALGHPRLPHWAEELVPWITGGWILWMWTQHEEGRKREVDAQFALLHRRLDDLEGRLSSTMRHMLLPAIQRDQ